MKTNVILLTAILFVSLIFSSCKKSENDPLLPFSTRDARITNSWELVSSSKSEVTVNKLEKTDTKIFEFDGTNMTVNHTDFFDSSSENIYLYSDNLEILKNNSYTQTIVNEGNVFEISSYWFWVDSDKTKIGIAFENGNKYIIQRLSKDELVLESSIYSTETNDAGETSTYTYNEILTYNAE